MLLECKLVSTILENSLIGCSVIEDDIFSNPVTTLLEKLTRAHRTCIRMFIRSLL